MAVTFKDNTDIVLRQLDANATRSMNILAPLLEEAVQKQMLYGYAKPILDTGRLADSIQAKTRRVSQNAWEVEVGTNVHYAKYVHDGTYKMAGRPFLRDSMLAREDEIKGVFSANLPVGF